MSASNNNYESLEELCQKRRRWVEITRENNFEEGIYKLLSEMYPDQAHFIYELLQNAEDAEASVVKFELSQQSLVATHNGKRLFNHEDVISITSIGDTKKSDDINQIGIFGVGFKAVFAYTNSPQIHSGSYSFEITDLVCPFKISPVEKKAEETVFIFPFNNSKKEATDCFNEIVHVFRHINQEILLFLNNIERIEWSIADGGKGDVRRTYLENIDPDLIRISIRNSINGNIQKDSWFLCFQKRTPAHDKLKCGVALKLEFRKSSQEEFEENRELSKQMKIVPVHGKLCVFFPADKETTGLKFHINGPYASAIDRASIPHADPDNKSLFAHTIELFMEIIERLKAKSLLTVDFLAVLPNNDDDLGPFYETLREPLYKTFRDHRLIPTQDGKFAKSGELVRGSKTFSEFFSNNDIFFLSRGKYQKWAANVMQQFRPDKLYDSLGIPRWKNEELFVAVKNRFCQMHSNDESDTWLTGKGINWIREFYLLLWGAVNIESIGLPFLKIILTEEGQLVKGKDAYFPPDENTIDLELMVVKKALLENLKSDKKKRLKDFLIKAGVDEIGEKETLENILGKYYAVESSKPSRKQHKKHMDKFISWGLESNDYSLFEHYCIFFDTKKELHTADKFFLDEPILETGLASIQSHKKQIPLWPGYVGVKGFSNFAEGAGVPSKLPIRSTATSRKHPDSNSLYENCYARWTYTGIDRDYEIQDIEEILKTPTKDIALLIWKTMCNADNYALEARFRPNQQYETKVAPSSLVYQLRNSSWIPAKDSKFYSPKEITRDELLDDFIYDNRNGWLDAIELGQEAQQTTEEYIEKQQTAQKLGINVEDADLIKDHPEEFQKFKESIMSNKVSADFPTKESNDPARRKKKLAKQLRGASKKSYDKKTRSVRTSRRDIDPGPWLLAKYTDESSGQMFCQLCQQGLEIVSFRKRDGEDCFESVEMFNKEICTIEHEALFLALCPLCAAKYKELVKKDSAVAEKFFRDLSENEHHEIPIQLGDEMLSLRFVGIHYNDLQVVLSEVSGENRKDLESNDT